MVQGQLGDEMFFINRGLVQVTQFINFVETPVRQLTDGGHFGEIALLSPDRRRTANVATINFCDLQMLERKNFDRIQREYAEFGEIVKSLSDKRKAEIVASKGQLKVNKSKCKVQQVTERSL